MRRPDDSSGALADLTVLDLCDEKGHLMGKLLGDIGARVIKIEPPGGERARNIGPFKNDVPDVNRSLHFWAHNTSKEAITLDIDSESGRQIFRRLVERADVVLESFAPGYLESLGLGYPELRAVNAALIMTSLTGFGQTGPYRDYKTSDLVALAMGGIMNSCGYDDVPGSPPIRPSGGHGYNIGAHYGAIGTLVALAFRDMTGEGQYIDASIHEACSCTTEAATVQYLYTKDVLTRRTGRHHSVRKTPKTLCRTRDGKLINIFAVFTSLSSWRALIRWLEESGMAEDLADDKYRRMVLQRTREGPEMEHIRQVIARFIAEHTAEEIYRDAQRQRFPWALVRAPEETLDDPHLWDRGFFARVQHPELGEEYIYPGSPYILDKTPWRTKRAPLVGEHNRAVYVEDLGMTEEEFTDLRDAGVI